MLASVCRFGNQDIFRLLGRDPMKSPLNSLEMMLFQRALIEVVQREYSTKDEFPTEIADPSLLGGDE